MADIAVPVPAPAAVQVVHHYSVPDTVHLVMADQAARVLAAEVDSPGFAVVYGSVAEVDSWAGMSFRLGSKLMRRWLGIRSSLYADEVADAAEVRIAAAAVVVAVEVGMLDRVEVLAPVGKSDDCQWETRNHPWLALADFRC